jgi:hypothetical protein
VNSDFSGKQLLIYQSDLSAVMEDDGSMDDDEVLDTVFQHNEKLGIITLPKEGEPWKCGAYTIKFSQM